MSHWSVITVGFEPHEEIVRIAVVDAVRTAATALPNHTPVKHKPSTECVHTTSPRWLRRDDQDSVTPFPNELDQFLDTLTYDVNAAEHLTYVAVVDSEDTGNSHHIAIYEVGDFEPAELVETETVHDGFNPTIDLDEYGLSHTVRL